MNPTELTEQFSGLMQSRKTSFLLRLIHDETVNFRAAYHFGGPDLDALRTSNEIVHRLSGLALNIVEPNRYASDADIIEAICEWVMPRGKQAMDNVLKHLRACQNSD